ncbi:MAG: XdhC family protein [Chloroflexi bacterium]|nr:XdhC family protein [Chloroflexota bacterium]
MYDLVDTIESWQRAGKDAVLARTVKLTGFGARTDGEVLALAADGSRAGNLLNGTPVEALAGEAASIAAGEQAKTVKLTIGDRQAIAAGLACGGVAEVLLQPLRVLPPEAWEAFRAGKPLAVVTPLDGRGALVVDGSGSSAGTLADAGAREAAVAEAREALAKARTSARVVDHEGTALFVETFVPQTHVLVVGRATLADALVAQGELLGWHTSVTDTLDESLEAVAKLKASDAVVLLTHDTSIDAKVLAAALQSGVGYVGALGSRKNQTGRRERLRDLGVGETDIAGLHGPVGLDIGAASPAETALAIAAEIVAARAQRNAAPLTGTAASIHA